MSYPVKNGQTSVVLRFKLLDSSSATGAGLTGLTSASSGLIISTIADNEASATAYTVAGSTIESISTLGTFATPTATKCRFKEVDSTNHKGLYEFQIANARFAVANAKSMIISVAGATNLAQADFVVPLVVDDPYTNKITSGSGTGQLITTSGYASINWGDISNQSAFVFLDNTETGTVAGNVLGSVGDISGGSAVASNVAAILSQVANFAFTVPFQLDCNVVGWKSATAPAMTGDAFARLGAPAGASISADIAAVKAVDDAVKAKTDNLPASPAAVGSAMTLTSGERNSIADAQLDRVDAIETGLTPRGAQRLQTAALSGKVSGAGTTTNTFRNAVADSKNRIVATVDTSGNRTAVTTDMT